MWREFREFAMRGNVIDLAVGIIKSASRWRTAVAAYIYRDGSARFDTLDMKGRLSTTNDQTGLPLLKSFAG